MVDAPSLGSAEVSHRAGDARRGQLLDPALVEPDAPADGTLMIAYAK